MGLSGTLKNALFASEKQRQQVLEESLNRISGGADFLSVTSIPLGNAGIKSLTDALMEKKTMKWLQLDDNRIGDAGASALAGLLAANTILRMLDLDYNLIGDTGAYAIASALHTNNNLVDLHLQCNRIRGPGALKIAKALEANSTLGTLSLHGNAIGNEGAAGLAQALQKNKTLRVLHLGSAAIGDDGATDLAQALARNRRLWALHLVNNKIGDMGATCLAKVVLLNPVLGELWLQDNQIGEYGAGELARCLRPPAKLRALGLTVSRVSDVQCKEIHFAFLKRHALQHAARNLAAGIARLDLNGRKLGDDGVKELSSAITVNSFLKEVHLKKNSISDVCVGELVQALMTCRNICKICLACNHIGDVGASMLAPLLEQPDAHQFELGRAVPLKLKELDLEHNRIGDAGAMDLADALERNASLEKLLLHRNAIGDIGISRLEVAMESSPTLKKLTFHEEPADVGAGVGDLDRETTDHFLFLKFQDQSTKDDEHSSEPSFDSYMFDEALTEVVRGDGSPLCRPFTQAFSPEFESEGMGRLFDEAVAEAARAKERKAAAAHHGEPLHGPFTEVFSPEFEDQGTVRL